MRARSTRSDLKEYEVCYQGARDLSSRKEIYSRALELKRRSARVQSRASEISRSTHPSHHSHRRVFPYRPGHVAACTYMMLHRTPPVARLHRWRPSTILHLWPPAAVAAWTDVTRDLTPRITTVHSTPLHYPTPHYSTLQSLHSPTLHYIPKQSLLHDTG